MPKDVILTPEGLQKLQDELRVLSTDKRREVAERIKEAREFGDISENSEYDDAKNEQMMLEQRIAQVQEKLRLATVIEAKDLSTDVVQVGSVVHVKDEATGKSVKYTIVGSAEARPQENKLSNESPVGRALLGRRRNETVAVQVPRGPARQLKITKIDVMPDAEGDDGTRLFLGVLRGARAPLVALLLSLTAAACGGGHAATTSTTSGGRQTGRTHHQRGRPTARTRAQAVAASIVLRHGDLPSFVPGGAKPTAAARQLADQLADCSGGVGPSSAQAYVRSRDFTQGGPSAPQISSHVTVLRSAGLVDRDIAASKTRRGQRCLQRYIRSLLNLNSSLQLAFNSVSLKPLTPPLTGVQPSFGFRLSVVAQSVGQRVRFYVDTFGFGVSRAEVELNALSLDKPFSYALERRLLGLLVRRARERVRGLAPPSSPTRHRTTRRRPPRRASAHPQRRAGAAPRRRAPQRRSSSRAKVGHARAARRA